MPSPFILATCGCIVLPLDRPGQWAGYVKCVLFQACDSCEGNVWCFHERDLESWKVHLAPGVQYDVERKPRPRPLSDAETDVLVKSIGQLVHMGYAGQDLASKLDRLKSAKKPRLARWNRSTQKVSLLKCRRKGTR